MTNMETIKLPCLKLLLTACMPTHATSKVSGVWTCIVPTNVLIPAHDKITNRHGNCFSDSHGLLWTNSPLDSGLAIHHHIHVGAGVVDPDLHWFCSCATDEPQLSGPCDRKESSHSPDDSRKSGLSGHL